MRQKRTYVMRRWQMRLATLCILCVSLIIARSACAADPPPLRRLSVGDLVQFTDNYGLTLAEVLGGPDPSNYYMLSSSSGEPLALPREKLRLVQSAGAPKAAFSVGDIVDRKAERYPERGVVKRVNGAWCEVGNDEGETDWVECKELRRVRAGTDL